MQRGKRTGAAGAQRLFTTYTLIKRCIKKGAIERSDPGFMCHALVPQAEVQEAIR